MDRLRNNIHNIADFIRNIPGFGRRPTYHNTHSPILIERARALISDPERWTTQEWARDSKGRPCRGDSPVAIQWCAYGALQHAAYDAGYRGWDLFIAVLRERNALNSNSTEKLECVNDHQGHRAVLDLMDRTIADPYRYH